MGRSLKNPRRFAKNKERRQNVVPDPSRHPKAGPIMGRPKQRIIDWQIIGMIESNVEGSPAQTYKCLVKFFDNRCPPGELVIGDRVDTWRRSERIENDWSINAGR